MAKLILGIDVGTTSLKTAIFDAEGAELSRATVEYSLLTPATNFVEAPCEIYMDSIRACMDKMRAKYAVNTEEVEYVSFSVQGETLCFVNEKGEALRNAIVWMDNRAGKQAEAMTAKFGNERCYKVTGQVSFEACWPAAKIQWVKENEPEIFNASAKILLLEDYIIYRLTGKYVAEGSLLCSSLYWDITTKKYWPEMLDYLGISEDMLPEIRESGEPVGTILPAMAKELGISENAVICTGCLDQVAGAIGVGNIRPGIFSENIGAALAVCVPTKTLTFDPNQLMPVHYFGVPDTYMMHTFTTGGMCLRWFRDAFCAEEKSVAELTDEDAYDLMGKEVASVPAGSEGMICLPHLQGSMAPDVNLNAKAVFYGATLKHKKPHFIRSVMESMGYIICRNLEAINDMGLPVNEIRSMGGGSKSAVWNQIKADITGKPLCLTAMNQDVACLGAAILAGVAGGVFKSVEEACDKMVTITHIYEPDQDKHRMYQRQYDKFKALFNALEPVYAMDAEDEQ